VHRTGILRHWLPEILIDLLREWHPDAVEQLRLPVDVRGSTAGRAVANNVGLTGQSGEKLIGKLH
jgi:hypothetical protein